MKYYRTLILHSKVNYLNPITNLWPKIFDQFCEVDYFGPGYVDDLTLFSDLKDYISKKPYNYDFVVVSEHISNPEGENDVNKRAKELVKIYGYSSAIATKFLQKKSCWLQVIDKLGIPVLYTFFEFDPYRTKEAWINRMNSFNTPYIMGWGPEFIKPLENLPELKFETFAQRASDSWRDYLLRRPNHILSMPSFVSNDEFNYTPLRARKKNWSVLGTNYHHRREARQVISNFSLSQSGKFLNHFVSLYDLLSKGCIGNKYFVKIANIFFRQALTQSKASFTCGSSLEYPIRKFFEIPASGCVLVTVHAEVVERLGFLKDYSYIFATPVELSRLTKEFSNFNSASSQRIASLGQELVRNNHSIQARTAQIQQCVKKILNGEFRGSQWENGVFHIK